MEHSAIFPSYRSSRHSVYTTTSSSTQWGPGALTGKAILAMGKAIVRGAENLIIMRRLGAIQAVMPCKDNNGDLSIESMFADLLELSKPSLYPDDIRSKAMQIIVAQIATEETRHLRMSISQWEVDSEELGSFVAEITGVALFSNRGCCATELVQVYTATLAKNLHPWSAFLSFIAQLAQLSKNTFPIAIHAQLLEILIWVSGRQNRALTQDTRIEAYCNVAFAVLSTCPTKEQDDLLTEQISKHRSDPDERPTSLAQLIQYLTLQEQWLAVERRLLEKHVHAMLNNLESWPTSNLGEIFLGSQSGVPRLADAPPSLPSTRNLVWCIGIGGNVQRQTVDYLSILPHQRMVFVLDRILRDMIIQLLIERGTPYSNLTRTPQFIAHVVQFLLGISQISASIKAAVMDAVILNILAFLEPLWKPWQIYEEIQQRAHVQLIRGQRITPSYCALILTLLYSVQANGLRNIVGPDTATMEEKQNLGRLLEPIVVEFLRVVEIP
ncbi:hypothetical protein K438DRAFT_1841965 [Mycena galopus ATCC 62051]|nr:hypothetical protein K438DRAFT_1841965 [Mycena galopus ATCC 62051]